MPTTSPFVFLRLYALTTVPVHFPCSFSQHRYGDVLTDKDGLPLVYDSDSIGRYWDKRPGEVRVPLHVGGTAVLQLCDAQ